MALIWDCGPLFIHGSLTALSQLPQKAFGTHLRFGGNFWDARLQLTFGLLTHLPFRDGQPKCVSPKMSWTVQKCGPNEWTVRKCIRSEMNWTINKWIIPKMYWTVHKSMSQNELDRPQMMSRSVPRFNGLFTNWKFNSVPKMKCTVNKCISSKIYWTVYKWNTPKCISLS